MHFISDRVKRPREQTRPKVHIWYLVSLDYSYTYRSDLWVLQSGTIHGNSNSVTGSRGREVVTGYISGPKSQQGARKLVPLWEGGLVPRRQERPLRSGPGRSGSFFGPFGFPFGSSETAGGFLGYVDFFSAISLPFVKFLI